MKEAEEPLCALREMFGGEKGKKDGRKRGKREWRKGERKREKVRKRSFLPFFCQHQRDERKTQFLFCPLSEPATSGTERKLWEKQLPERGNFI